MLTLFIFAVAGSWLAVTLTAFCPLRARRQSREPEQEEQG
jgi:hypothetical protein